MFCRTDAIKALLLLALFMSAGCHHRPAPSQGADVASAAPSPAPVADTAIFGDSDMEDAWRRFAKGGRYRIAQATDFRFSDDAQKDIGMGRYNEYVNYPVAHWWPGIGMVVVDTTRTDQERFGLVVFLGPDMTSVDKKQSAYPCRPVWLYKNKDLSQTFLTGASGYCLVIQYEDSGKPTITDKKEWLWRHRKSCA